MDALQRKLVGEWRIGGGLEKRLCVPDVFGEYIAVWLKRSRMDLWEVCHFPVSPSPPPTSEGVSECGDKY
jgi:hypothetical protein